ncbi:MAG: alpha/beta hydrolase [Thermoanaerobaculales bacterium]|nr:alpha/beta hydrolase [Thermoanaerobaculales bacterium]
MAIDVEPVLYGEITDHRPLLLLLHAFPLDSRMWRPQAQGLAHLAPVLTLDLPGFGKSREVALPKSLDAWADAVAETTSEVAGERPVVVAGLSMGGYVALRLIARHRDLVSGLILADTRSGNDHQEVRTARDEAITEVAADGIEPLAQSMLPKLLSEHCGQELADAVHTIMLDQDPIGIMAALTAMRDRPDSSNLLPKTNIPVLVIVGAEDTLTPPEESEAMAAAIPGARLAVVPNSGHLTNLENPIVFNETVASFLKDEFLFSYEPKRRS